MKDYEIAVFSEVNEHMRNTEQKQIAISVAYLGVVGVVVSLLPSEGGAILTPSSLTFSVWLLLAITGCTVLALQKWYRVWKEHYMDKIRNTANRWNVDSTICACWMDMQPKCIGSKPRPDNLHMYFTLLLNTSLFLYGSYKWVEWLSYSSISLVCITISILSYIAFLGWAHSLKVCESNTHNA